MKTDKLDDLLDRVVAEYSERLARSPQDDGADLLRPIPEEHRDAIARCFRMMRAGLSAAPSSRAKLGPGVTLAGYRIERELGRGGMAVVYLATQLDLKRPVALKVLRPGLAIEGRHVDRFQREALAAARIQHPHIVQVYAVGETDGHHWLAMEFVDGRTLAEVYAALPRASERTADALARAVGLPRDAYEGQSYEQALCSLLAPIARALAVTHDLGLIHRDIKPSNILITNDGRVRLADFGLAKGDGDPGLSLTGEPLGTPYYMSPEQATLTVHKVDARSDVYSFGVTLFEGLAGRCPFTGPTLIAVLDALRNGQPPPIRSLNRGVTRNVEALVRRAMAREPKDRYFSAMELAADCQTLATGGVTQALVAEGGPLRRLLREVRAGFCSRGGGYRSSIEFLGLPLIHIHGGMGQSGKRRVAKGWIAIGDIAVGGCAIGGIACGGVALGGVSAGVVSVAGLSAGVIAMGGVALGGLAVGGLGVGWTAVSSQAVSVYALADKAYARHAVTYSRRDPEAVEFFLGLEPWLPWFPQSELLFAPLHKP